MIAMKFNSYWVLGSVEYSCVLIDSFVFVSFVFLFFFFLYIFMGVLSYGLNRNYSYLQLELHIWRREGDRRKKGKIHILYGHLFLARCCRTSRILNREVFIGLGRSTLRAIGQLVVILPKTRSFGVDY